jgi:heme exporter protein D
VTYDAATWGVFACVLSALGGVLTYLAWQRGKIARAVRGAGWTVLPIAAWMTGTLRLAAEVVGDVGDWAARLVFSPVVWLGVCLAGVSAVLFGVSGVIARHSGEQPRKARAAKVRAAKKSAKQTGQLNQPKASSGGPGDAGGTDGVDGMDDIEAILKKHGIS